MISKMMLIFFVSLPILRVILTGEWDIEQYSLAGFGSFTHLQYCMSAYLHA